VQTVQKTKVSNAFAMFGIDRLIKVQKIVKVSNKKRQKKWKNMRIKKRNRPRNNPKRKRRKRTRAKLPKKMMNSRN